MKELTHTCAAVQSADGPHLGTFIVDTFVEIETPHPAHPLTKALDTMTTIEAEGR